MDSTEPVVINCLRRRPHSHVIIVGKNRIAYGKILPDGKTYQERYNQAYLLPQHL